VGAGLECCRCVSCVTRRYLSFAQLEDMEQRLKQAAEAMRLREEQVAEMDRRALEVAAKLKVSQAMYETIRVERNAASKTLKENKAR
jgi:hypothetical protein